MNQSPVTPEQSFHHIPQDWATFAFSTTSTPTRRTPSRVTKPGYFYTSPQGVQRRRTTASHSSRGSSLSQKEVRNVTQYQRDGSIRRRWPASTTRPVSWHPGAHMSQRFLVSDHPTDQHLGQTINGLEHLQVSGEHLFPLETPGGVPYPLPENFDTYNPSNPLSTQSMYGAHLNLLPNYVPQPMSAYTESNSYDPNVSMSFGDMQQLYLSSASVPVAPALGTDLDNPLYNPHLPINPQISSQQYLVPQAQSLSTRPRNKKSKELVAMGLYDDAAQVQRESIGKTLKLEDSWQPPEKEKEKQLMGEHSHIDGQEEDSSTDEDEEETLALPSTAVSHSHVPVYQDLSNQSFFFEDDDSYTNLMPVASELPMYQPKLPEDIQASFSWT